MILEETTTALTELPDSRQRRSEGIHVSNIIRCIAQESGILKPQWCDDVLSLTDVRSITDPIAILRISIGLAWEEWYIPQLPGVVDHPGEMEVDGVYMTHDGESLDTYWIEGRKTNQITIQEVKATYKSLRTVTGEHKRVNQAETGLQSQWMWLSQIMAYCKGAETRYAKLHVLFICGDYTPPISPMLKIWNLEFTQEEIDNNWKLLTEYKEGHQ